MRLPENRIRTYRQFRQWVEQDRVMSGYSAKPSLKERLVSFFAPNYILQFLYQLRKVEYLSNCKSGVIWGGSFDK